METTTADFLVGPIIAEGAFGTVLYGKHKQTNQEVAIKVIEKVAISKHHPYLFESIWKERRLLQQLNVAGEGSGHSYVVSLWASFHDTQCVYLVMECCHGGTLATVIEQGLKQRQQLRHAQRQRKQPQSPELPSTLPSQPLQNDFADREYVVDDPWYKSIPHYSLQLIHALKYIHDQNIVHCDLKPENILCTHDGRLKLGDFGSAIVLSSPSKSQSMHHQGKSEESSTSTSAATEFKISPIGTVDYSSPELLRGIVPTDFTVDLWSLGCILYACFVGRSPFHAESDALSVKQIFDYVRDHTTSTTTMSSSSITLATADSCDEMDNSIDLDSSLPPLPVPSWLPSSTPITPLKDHELSNSTDAIPSQYHRFSWDGIPANWCNFIRVLLHPEPVERLNMCPCFSCCNDENVNHPTAGLCSSPGSWYDSIVTGNCHACQSSATSPLVSSSLWNTLDLNQSPHFVPAKPKWLLESKETPLKDGAHGWVAFLL